MTFRCRWKRIAALAFSAAVLLLLLGSCGGGVEMTRMTVGRQLPEFDLPSLTGDKVDSRSLAGKIVVLNFWATWCQPCLKEIPELRELAQDDRWEIIGVALDTEGETIVRPFVERHRMSYTILLGDQEIFQRMGGFSIPYTLVLDRSQQVVNIYRGPASREDLEEDLRKIEQAV